MKNNLQIISSLLTLQMEFIFEKINGNIEIDKDEGIKFTVNFFKNERGLISKRKIDF